VPEQADVINSHPLRNDRTTAVASKDLIAYAEACNHPPTILNFVAADGANVGKSGGSGGGGAKAGGGKGGAGGGGGGAGKGAKGKATLDKQKVCASRYCDKRCRA
jgi:hypothetical protein